MAKRSQLVTPLDKVEALPDFEGHQVVAVGVEAPGISGGLNDALTVDPLVFHSGDDIAVVIIGRIKRVVHEPIDREDLAGDQRRVHVMTVDEAGIVPISAVDGLLAAQRDAVDAARIEAERAQGIHRLPVDGHPDEDDEESALGRAHNQGEHAGGLVSDCPLCRLEAEFAAEENGTTVEEELERRRAAQ